MAVCHEELEGCHRYRQDRVCTLALTGDGCLSEVVASLLTYHPKIRVRSMPRDWP